jgi:EAL and modified HD-GYP domain-containing signal transduction protein
MFDRPMGQVLKSMPVADEIRLALERQEGLPGHVLSCVQAYERGEWEKVRHSILRQQEPLGEVYVEAVDWADEVSTELAEAG